VSVLELKRNIRTVLSRLASLVFSWFSAVRRAVSCGSPTAPPGLPAGGEDIDAAEQTAALERVLTECAQRHGEEHPDTIAARNNLAGRYAATGRRDIAVTEFERALSDAVRTLGEHHVLAEVVRENLAVCHEDADRFGDAAHHWQQLVAQRAARLGRHHPDTLLARARLAVACRRAGRLREAADHYRDVLQHSAAFSAEDVEAWRLGLARTLRRMGQDDECRAQLRLVVAQRRLRLGVRHPRTLAVHYQLGLSYARSGRPEEAVRVLREVYRHCLAAVGDPEVRRLALRVRRELAAAYRAAGRPQAVAALR
jgi:tetratricopeptide (TPR) repeat protein